MCKVVFPTPLPDRQRYLFIYSWGLEIVSDLLSSHIQSDRAEVWTEVCWNQKHASFYAVTWWYSAQLARTNSLEKCWANWKWGKKITNLILEAGLPRLTRVGHFFPITSARLSELKDHTCGAHLLLWVGWKPVCISAGPPLSHTLSRDRLLLCKRKKGQVYSQRLMQHATGLPQ